MTDASRGRSSKVTGAYAFGVFMTVSARPEQDDLVYQEIDFVATPGLLVTVRKTPREGGGPFDPAGSSRRPSRACPWASSSSASSTRWPRPFSPRWTRCTRRSRSSRTRSRPGRRAGYGSGSRLSATSSCTAGERSRPPGRPSAECSTAVWRSESTSSFRRRSSGCSATRTRFSCAPPRSWTSRATFSPASATTSSRRSPRVKATSRRSSRLSRRSSSCRRSSSASSTNLVLISRTSRTITQPVRVPHVVSSTIVPGR